MALAAGQADGGTALVLAVHVERCPHCQDRVRDFEAIGGALLESIEPALLTPGALAVAREKIDALAAPAEPPQSALRARRLRHRVVRRAQLPDGQAWPRSLDSCSISRWYWIGPGMRWSRVRLAHDRSANVFLLRIAAGKCLPQHSHSELEITQVLYGSFSDGRARFGSGDFDETDGSVEHRPVVDAGGECICLAAVKGKVLFEGALARAFGSLVGM